LDTKLLRKYDIPDLIISPYYWKIPFKYGPFPKNLRKYVLDNFECYLPIQQILKLQYTAPRKLESLSMISPYQLAAAGGCTQGADIEQSATASTTSFSAGFIRSGKITGTVPECYDQVAVSVTIAAGNTRLALYNADGTPHPDVLMGETDSHTTVADYTFHSMTEFDLDTATNYIAHQNSVASTVNSDGGGASGDMEFRGFTFGAYPDPFGGPTASTFLTKWKIGHS